MSIKYPSCVESLTLLNGGRLPRAQDFLRLAYQYAWEFSDDPKTKNGSVLVTKSGRLFYGCNHFPDGITPTPELLESKNKDPLIVHAEADCILHAAKAGVSTYESDMYCCWALCIPCAQPILEAGVSSVTTHKQMHDKTYPKYLEAIEQAVKYITDAGVHYERFDGPICGCEGMMNHEHWEP